MRGKCEAVARRWISQKVTHIIVFHDLDSNDRKKYSRLYNELSQKLSFLAQKAWCIVIPIEELEAWFLSDTGFLNRKFPGIDIKEIHHPEKIADPKEFIARASRIKCKPRYLYTIHNKEIAGKIDISLIRKKCPQFKDFHNFVLNIGVMKKNVKR